MRLRLIFAMALLVCFLPALAAADPITISLLRDVHAEAIIAVKGVDVEPTDDQQNADILSANAQAALGLNSASGAASMSSTTSRDSRRLSGVGSASGTATSVANQGDGTNSSGGGEVLIIWEFLLDQPHTFIFSGTLASVTQPFAGAGLTASLQSGLDVGTGQVELFSTTRQTSGNVGESGNLAPGPYQFRLNAGAGTESIFDGSSAASAAFRFTFDVIPQHAPVPEPGSLTLLATGVLTLASSMRKRSR